MRRRCDFGSVDVYRAYAATDKLAISVNDRRGRTYLTRRMVRQDPSRTRRVYDRETLSIMDERHQSYLPSRPRYPDRPGYDGTLNPQPKKTTSVTLQLAKEEVLTALGIDNRSIKAISSRSHSNINLGVGAGGGKKFYCGTTSLISSGGVRVTMHSRRSAQHFSFTRTRAYTYLDVEVATTCDVRNHDRERAL